MLVAKAEVSSKKEKNKTKRNNIKNKKEELFGIAVVSIAIFVGEERNG
jgi:hypothetical protein